MRFYWSAISRQITRFRLRCGLNLPNSLTRCVHSRLKMLSAHRSTPRRDRISRIVIQTGRSSFDARPGRKHLFPGWAAQPVLIAGKRQFLRYACSAPLTPERSPSAKRTWLGRIVWRKAAHLGDTTTANCPAPEGQLSADTLHHGHGLPILPQHGKSYSSRPTCSPRIFHGISIRGARQGARVPFERRRHACRWIAPRADRRWVTIVNRRKRPPFGSRP